MVPGLTPVAHRDLPTLSPAQSLPCRPDDVVGLTLSAQGDTFEIRRDPDAGDRWQVNGGTAWLQARPVVVEELLTRVAGHQVRDYFPPAELAAGQRRAYGLEAPWPR